MKHMRLVSQQPQKAQTMLDIKLENMLGIMESLGIYVFTKFGSGSIR